MYCMSVHDNQSSQARKVTSMTVLYNNCYLSPFFASIHLIVKINPTFSLIIMHKFKQTLLPPTS